MWGPQVKEWVELRAKTDYNDERREYVTREWYLCVTWREVVNGMTEIFLASQEAGPDCDQCMKF